MTKVVKLPPKPEGRPTRSDIYRAAAKARLIGTVDSRSDRRERRDRGWP
jgi:hypothetical protein